MRFVLAVSVVVWCLATEIRCGPFSANEVRRPQWREDPGVGPPEVLGFRRDAVENAPSRAASAYVEASPDAPFGSQRFPIRDAVEASPWSIGHKEEEKRDSMSESLREPYDRLDNEVPLRVAVEHREAPFFLDSVDHESIWIEPLVPPTLRGQQPLGGLYEPKIVCRFEAGALRRADPFALLPEALPDFKCTHLVYSAAVFDPQKGVVSQDPERDEIKGGYKTITDLRSKNPALIVLLSVVVRNKDRISSKTMSNQMATSIKNFLKRHNFDGIEIDWDDSEGLTEDSRSFLKAAAGSLTKRGLTVAISLGSKNLPDPELVSIADLIVLKAWREKNNKFAVHPAPFYYVVNTIEEWAKRVSTESRRKIVVGLPIFGQGYTLEYGNFTDAGASISGPGKRSLYTELLGGKLPYYEICEKLEERLWISGRDEEGPYLKRGDQWIGYDDPISVKIKVAYVRSVGLAGVSLTSIDFDDFLGICGESWPMLNAAARGLGFYEDMKKEKCPDGSMRRDPNDCSRFYSCVKGVLKHGYCGFGRFFEPTIGRCVNASPEICEVERKRPDKGVGDSVENNGINNEKEGLKNGKLKKKKKSPVGGPRVFCYVTSWAIYRKEDGRFVPERIDPELCTDVVYAFAGLNPDTLVIQAFDPWADIEHNLYDRVTSIDGPRILLGLGGWTDSSKDKYSRLISSAATRRRFVSNAVNYLRKYGFDGLSLEWNYPRCWQSDCRKGPASDKPNFTKLLQELKKEFDRQDPKLYLSIALSGYKEIIDLAYEVDEISKTVDSITVMSYDYRGAWESKTGHPSPLFSSLDSHPYYNVNFTVQHLIRLGADKSKLIVGIPLYGQTYRLTDTRETGVGAPASGPGAPGDFTRQPGMLAYYEICDRIKRNGWKVEPGPVAHYKDQWVGYEDRESIFAKGKYIMRNGYGGAAMWAIDLDDFLNRCCTETFPLLKSINRALGRLATPVPTSDGDCRRPSDPVTPQPPTLTTHSDAVEDGHHHHHPTKPITTSSTPRTTWPEWTQTTKTTWPTWSWTTKSTTTTSGSSRPWTTRIPTNRPITTVTHTTTRRPTFTEVDSSVEGTACGLGQYINDPENCGSYYRCVLGSFRREQCAPGLHWDMRRGFCDWPASVKCQLDTEYVSTTRRSTTRTWTTRIPTTTRRPITEVAFDVTQATEKPGRSCEHGRYYAYPNSCTNFQICVNGNLVTRQCGTGLNWDDTKSMCVWAFEKPCTEAPKKNSLLIMKNVSEDCIPGSYTGVPGDCASYRACLWGHHELFKCAPGLHFNEKTLICDWPTRAKCQWSESSNEEIDQSPPSTSSPWWTSTTPSTTQFTTSNTTPQPSPEVDPDKVSPLSGYYKVVCYFTNWAWYRRGIGRYLPEHIDHTLCTHIVYGFAVLDYSELIIKAHDSWADYDNRFYERVVAYKKRGLKVLLALGGWNDSAGDKYSRLVNSPSARKKFVDQAVGFVTKYGFDGLDLDWEYPVCWQVNCKKGPASDKEGFTALLKELNGELKRRNLLLSAAVSPNKKVIDKAYDVPALAKYLDWIAVMAYDYHGQWDKKTGHVAPLYYHPEDDNDYFNANYTINYWISKGAPPRTLVMGIPLYGQSFGINDRSAGNGLNVPASAGHAGEFTRAAGFLAYYEICHRIGSRGWTVVRDPEGRIGPYAYKGEQWVGFDDAETVRRKAQYIKDMGLGGGMVWALDLDDFRGRCEEGRHPLMHALQRELADEAAPISPAKPTTKPVITGDHPTTLDAPRATTASWVTKEEEGQTEDEYKVICYFTNWAWYRQNGGKYLPEDIDPELCTHVLYGFAVLDSSSLTIKPHDSWADLDNKFYERVAAYKSKGIKVLVAIGGWNDSAGGKYSRLVNSPNARRKFVAHVVDFIEKYGFEGLDLDWEYPVCWQVDCEKGPASDKEGFVELARELSEAFKPKGYLLSAAVSPSKRVIDAGYDVPALNKYLDWISVMTYDYHGQWDKKTGHVAPLYELPNDWEPTFNANFTINYWIEKGASPKKLVMGAPLYGQSFSLAERSESGLNAPTYGGGEAGEATRARGFLAYYEICERTLQKGWSVVQDKERRIGPYAFRGDQWVSFDDAKQIQIKCEFIKKMGLGGGMVWALDLDDFKDRCGCEPNPLLRTMNRVLRNYPKGPLCPITQGNTAIDLEFSTTQSTLPGASSETVRPTYLPPTVPTTTSADLDDTIEVEVGPLPVQPIGDCGGRTFIPHEIDCTKYYLCNFGKLSEHSCPPGLYWNENRCDWPENTSCDKHR